VSTSLMAVISSPSLKTRTLRCLLDFLESKISRTTDDLLTGSGKGTGGTALCQQYVM